ncbi:MULTISPECIES: MBL fold metallo-hydrolase [unclassified Shewanella]|uniref:MBL fold metallo-hydrolase n=1 Tax=unclassified Shewanella TaxID=196818 RepID=UPI001E42AE5F|nr:MULTISPECIES: MBL fold metallo-hydrolase [unclassified Shewanella]
MIQHGLFEVTENIYQIRGFDLTNITFIKGKTGWIVFDPLISPETAKAALDFINKQLGERPVVAIVYSHSHIDHYGGATGIATAEEVASGKVQVISPEHFTEHAVSENVIAGNAMGRRAVYM